MMKHARVLGLGTLVLALGIWSLAVSESTAADEKEAREIIQKIAALLEKGDEEGAKKEAKAASKKVELFDVMTLFALRAKKGFGFGEKPGSTPDGIEARLINMARKAPPQAQIDKEAGDIVKMAYRAAAISEMAILATPEKDMGMKKKKDWDEWAKEMRQSALQLAEAAKAKKAADIKAVVTKLNSSCNNCHGVFRD